MEFDMKNEEKQTESNSNMKTKRDQYAVEIRKKKNEATLNAKRMRFASSKDNDAFQTKVNAMKHSELEIIFKENVEQFFKAAANEDYEKLYEAIQGVRKIVAIPENAPLELLHRTEFSLAVAALLDDKFREHIKIQHEAAWILTNLAGGKSEYTYYCVQTLKVIERFINILKHEQPYKPDQRDEFEELKDQAAWGLCNVAGDGDELRNICLSFGVLDLVLAIIANSPPMKTKNLRTFLWVVTNLCRGPPFPSFEKVSKALPLAINALKETKDIECLVCATWTLAYLSQGPDEQVKVVAESVDKKMIVEFASSEDTKVLLFPALRVIGNLLSGDQAIAEELIDYGLLPVLSRYLRSQLKMLRKETLWCLSNILANGVDLIDYVFEVEGLISNLFLLMEEDDLDVKFEVMHCFCNIASEGTIAQISELVDKKLINMLIELLNRTQESDHISIALEILQNIFDCALGADLEDGDHDKFLRIFEQAGGFKTLETLYNHKDPKIPHQIGIFVDNFLLKSKN